MLHNHTFSCNKCDNKLHLNSKLKMNHKECCNTKGLTYLFISDHTGCKEKNEPPILRFSNFIFALITSIYQNELFIMNSSLKRGTLGSIGQLKLKILIKKIFESDLNFYIFVTRFKKLRICG